jgi:hypothetical protein
MASNFSSFESLPCYKEQFTWAPVAHACNGRYSGGSHQEDGSWIPARAIVIQTLFHNFQHTNRAATLAEGMGSEFQSRYNQPTHKKEMIVIIGILLLPWTMNVKKATAVNKQLDIFSWNHHSFVKKFSGKTVEL